MVARGDYGSGLILFAICAPLAFLIVSFAFYMTYPERAKRCCFGREKRWKIPPKTDEEMAIATALRPGLAVGFERSC